MKTKLKTLRVRRNKPKIKVVYEFDSVFAMVDRKLDQLRKG